MECPACSAELKPDENGLWYCSTEGCSRAFSEKDKEKQREKLEKLLEKSFKKIFENINASTVRNEVDKHGIDKFIHKCARNASVSGFAAGAGGFLSMAAVAPLDIINTVVQHFRVAIAVNYHKTGAYQVSFEQTMKIVGISLGVRAGTFTIGVIVAREIIKRLAVAVPAKSIPFLGGIAGAGMNYAYIVAVGSSLKAISFD
jgi:hypothetical protein